MKKPRFDPVSGPGGSDSVSRSAGRALVAVTLGRDGALIGNENGIVKAEGFSSHAVDTTGAGDSFWGGFLASYLQEETSPEHRPGRR